MDNLTHTLTGVVLAQSGLSRTSRGASIALVLASNIPDVDLLFGLQGATSYLQHHRDLSHSVVGAPLLALGRSRHGLPDLLEVPLAGGRRDRGGYGGHVARPAFRAP